MKKVFSVLLICTLVLSIMPISRVPSHAQETVTLSKPEVIQVTDSETGLVTQSLKVSGTGGEAYSRKVVTIAVILDGLDKTSAANYTAFSQCIMSEAGSFEKEILFDNQAGIYIVRVGVQGMDTPREEKITVPEVSGINDFVTTYRNDGFDKSSLRGKILQDGDKLSIDLAIFQKLSGEKQLAICEEILKGDKNLFFEEIKEKIDRTTALQAVSGSESAEIILENLTHYNRKYYSFEEDAVWESFLQSSGTFQKSVLETLRRGSYADFPAVKEALYEIIAVMDFTNVSVASDIKAKITKYQNYMASSDMTAYEAFSTSKKNNMASYLYKQRDSFANMNEIAEAFGYVIAHYDTLFPASGGGNTPSGGGSRPSGGNQTIQMPSDINQEPAPTQVGKPVETQLTDLSGVSWAEEAIMSLFRQGVISGKGNGIFDPNASVTRGEFIKILAGACGLTSDGQKVSFADVTEEHWAYPYVAGGFFNGIVRGMSDTEFGVDNQITREDMCTMAYRVISLKGKMVLVENPETKFADMDMVSDYAVYSAQMLSSYGIVSGYPDGTFAPKEMVTRAEAAQLVYTLGKYLEGGND